MREDFNNIINELETNQYFGVSVFDITGAPKPIIKNYDKEKIIEQYGSVSNFFNGIFQNGVQKIGIQPLTKNGKRDGKYQSWINNKHLAYFEVSLVPNSEPVAPIVAPAPAYQSSQPVNYGYPEMLGNPGLGAIGLHIAAASAPELKMENQLLKERIKDLEKLNREYERSKDREETEIERMKHKAESNQKMLETATPLLAPFMEKMASMMSGNAGVMQAIPQGLGNPENLSEVKAEMMQAIQQQSDATVDYLLRVLQGMNNQDFINELTESLKKINLIE